MSEMNVTTLKASISELHSEGFIAYCGAGISMSAPTSAPSWVTLAEDILFTFFERVPADWGLPNDLIVSNEDRAQKLNPEDVFENFAKILDEQFYPVFKALDTGKPNGNHQLLARLAKIGVLKGCFTTNFDIYIERALQEEGVEYQLLVSNDEYHKYTEHGGDGKFLLCKIHGTIERPETIVSVASVYKTSKGFSVPKQHVLKSLMDKYPILFVGYSGADFKHSNYVKFWNWAAPSLKKIYWMEKSGDARAIDFSQVFHGCRDRFTFTEASNYPPDCWIEALELANVPNLSLDVTVIPWTEWGPYAQQVAADRKNVIKDWSECIPEAHLLSVAMTEGESLSKSHQDQTDAYIAAGKEATEYTEQLRSGEISVEEFTEKTTGLYDTPSNDQEQEILGECKFNLETDSVAELNQETIPPSFITHLEGYYTVLSKNATVKVLEKDKKWVLSGNIAWRIKEEDETFNIYADEYSVQQQGEACPGEEALTYIYVESVPELNQGIISSTLRANLEYSYIQLSDKAAVKVITTDKEWGLSDNQTWVIKEEQGYISVYSYTGDVEKLAVTTTEKPAAETNSTSQSTSVEIPVTKLLQKMQTIVEQSSSAKEFVENCKVMHLAYIYRMSHTFEEMMQWQEYQTITAKTSQVSVGNIDQEALMKLGEQFSCGEITQDQYMQKMTELSTAGDSGEQPQIPIEDLDALDQRFNSHFETAFAAQKKHFGEAINESRILLEMIKFNTFVWSMSMIDNNEVIKMTQRSENGEYPLVLGNASVAKYLWCKNEAWIEQGLKILPNRFAQQLCHDVIVLAQMNNDFELCKRTTERSLELTEGKISEATARNVPVSLATMYLHRGDKTMALELYKKSLDGIKLAHIHTYTDSIVYQCAKLVREFEGAEAAFKILSQYHVKYAGLVSPYRAPAYQLGINLAKELAAELGYNIADL